VIVGTERRAVVDKKGFMAGATLGRLISSYDYRNIIGIEAHIGMMDGAVVITPPGRDWLEPELMRELEHRRVESPERHPDLEAGRGSRGSGGAPT
jgi:hypothetical protein